MLYSTIFQALAACNVIGVMMHQHWQYYHRVMLPLTLQQIVDFRQQVCYLQPMNFLQLGCLYVFQHQVFTTLALCGSHPLAQFFYNLGASTSFETKFSQVWRQVLIIRLPKFYTTSVSLCTPPSSFHRFGFECFSSTNPSFLQLGFLYVLRNQVFITLASNVSHPPAQVFYYLRTQ